MMQIQILQIHRDAGEGSVAVIQPRQNKRRHQRLENGPENGPADTSWLTQYGEADTDGLRDMRPQGSSSVFRRLRKTNSDDADMIRCGRLFQTPAAATGKARSSIVDNRVRWTISDGEEAERRRRQASKSAGWLSSSARYDGAAPC